MKPLGVVRLAKWRGTPVAIKAIKTEDDEGALAEFRTEVALVRNLHHPHIVQFLGVVEYSQTKFGVVTEVMAGGGLDKARKWAKP